MQNYDLTNNVSRQKLYDELDNLKKDYQREIDDNEANYRKKQKELKKTENKIAIKSENLNIL